MKILVTGVAGFIGMHASIALLERGDEVIGIDSLNHYYDVTLKEARLAQLKKYPKFTFYQENIANTQSLNHIFNVTQPKKVLHLAAQAGVRYSLENPQAYVESNLQGFVNILECCRHGLIEHLVYASSSSVYGGNEKHPFSERDSVDHPISLYAATKKSNELMAHTYSHLFKIPTTGLRFFTVYGPWGRPDMALFLFTKAMIEGRSIDVYNHGKMIRDFTYIDDIVEGMLRVLDKPATADVSFNPQSPNSASSSVPYRIFNLGNSHPTSLMEYIGALEKAIGTQAIKNYLPIQPGDVLLTASDMSLLENWVDYRPNTPVEVGIQKFVIWYRDFYHC